MAVPKYLLFAFARLFSPRKAVGVGDTDIIEVDIGAEVVVGLAGVVVTGTVAAARALATE